MLEISKELIENAGYDKLDVYRYTANNHGIPTRTTKPKHTLAKWCASK